MWEISLNIGQPNQQFQGICLALLCLPEVRPRKLFRPVGILQTDSNLCGTSGEKEDQPWDSVRGTQIQDTAGEMLEANIGQHFDGACSPSIHPNFLWNIYKHVQTADPSAPPGDSRRFRHTNVAQLSTSPHYVAPMDPMTSPSGEAPGGPWGDRWGYHEYSSKLIPNHQDVSQDVIDNVTFTVHGHTADTW